MPKFMKRLRAARKAYQANIGIDTLDKLLELHANQGAFGSSVQDDRSLHISAWFNGVQQICQTVASLPLFVYKRTTDGSGFESREKHRLHPVYNLLHGMANPLMPSFIWKETAQNHLINYGNHYSYIRRDAANRPRELWPLNPAAVEIEVDDKWNRTYIFRNNSGRKIVYPDYSIFHIPGLGFDGIRGYSVLTLARESLTLGRAQDTFANRFYENGTHITKVLTHPETLKPQSRANLKESLQKQYGGVDNAGRTIVLEEGMKLESIGMQLKDAQFLESRVFHIQEVARWLNMPPHKLKDLSRATYDNIASEQMSYYIDTLRPWLERWEAIIDVKLLGQDPNVYSEYLIDALFRADIKTRYDSYAVARNNGWMNANEIRQRENLSQLPGDQGNVYWMPENMKDAREYSKVELAQQIADTAPEETEAPDANA
jgi:HK97 family phage portal protein